MILEIIVGWGFEDEDVKRVKKNKYLLFRSLEVIFFIIIIIIINLIFINIIVSSSN